MEAMKSVDHPLTPVQAGPPTEEDLGFNLGVSSPDTGTLAPPRPWLQISQLTWVWLLWCVVLAGASLLFVFTAGDASRLLAETAAGAAVVFLVGAGLLHARGANASQHSLTRLGFLFLAPFCIALVQFLFAMIKTQDASLTALVLLMVMGYALVAPSTESLLTFVTIALAGWSACILRFPEGAWQPHVIPWFAAVALAMLIQQRSKEHLVTQPRSLARRPSLAGIDVSVEHQLHSAIAARDEAQAQCRKLEDRLQSRAGPEPRWEEDLFFLQESSRELAQDVTLDEIGAAWLERLGHRLGARQASLWLDKPGSDLRLLMGISEASQTDLDALLTRSLQAGQLQQSGEAWCLPLDLGLHGRAAVLLQGMPDSPPPSATKLLQASGAALNVFLRWQLADTENDSLTQQLHQQQEAHNHNQQDGHTQDQSSRSLAEHLKQQLETAQNELNHWKAESEQWHKLVEEAQTEYDTLSQLLSETETELKHARAESSSVGELQKRLRQLEQDHDDQLREAETARQRAEAEAHDAVEEWQRESLAVSRLTVALRSVADATGVFDAQGDLCFENEAAQALRGSLRNRPGEHPLWKAITPETLTLVRRDGRWQGEVFVVGPSELGRPYLVTVQLVRGGETDAFAIIAHARESEEEKRKQRDELEAARTEVVRSGTRFFAGLARTLRPPTEGLIDHAAALLEHAGDAEVRRSALVGILRHARHVRSFLTQAFDYAELEAGTAAVVRSKLSPWQLLHDVIHSFRCIANDKGLRLSVHPTSSLPPTITSDGDRLRHLLHDLLAHTMHLASTDVHVRVGGENVSAVSTRTARLEIIIDCSDETTQFNEIDRGFQLNILRRQAVALGGELLVSHASPKAGRLTLLLPVTATEQAAALPSDQLPLDDPEPFSATTLPLDGHVLLVLDDHEAQRVVTFHLERLGLRTRVAAEGQLALQLVSEETFDAVLWAADKTDLSAVAAASRLRTAGYGGSIIMILANPGGELREAFQHAGGTARLDLPVVPSAWRQTLASCLPAMEAGEEASTMLLSDFAADQAFLPLLRSFVATLPGQLAQLRAAAQVADLAGLARRAHDLTTHAELYGYPPLATLARNLEHSILTGCDSHHLSSLLDAVDDAIHQVERGLRKTVSSHVFSLPTPLSLAA
jgi:signal transduction histidine kinase/HPt (histidine-containing phosphotransfer) domain-containing protein